MPLPARFFAAAALMAVTAVVLAGPWRFGAWEMWGFWPFATAIFAATACLGASLVARAARRPPAPAPPRTGAALLAVAYLPFLVYAAIRCAQTPVHLYAERAFLIHLTGWLVAVIVLATAGACARRLIFAALALDLFLLGAYGLANHFITHNRYVLGVPGFAQYYLDNRATGSYFCPDHFSGIMEIAVCVGLAAVLLGRGLPARAGGAVLVGVGILGVVLSKSRGGGLTLGVVAVAALVWGLAHLPRAVRYWWRLAAACVLVGVAVAVGTLAQGYMQRFHHYVGWHVARDKPPREALAFALDVLRQQDRPQMAAAALRAWRSAPWLGIGPGMHPVLWPHFGPTADGDRDRHLWPSAPNNARVANAVHNDWVQLLEEYGVVGVALFLPPAVALGAVLRRRLRRATDRLAAPTPDDQAPADAMQALAALLTGVAMAFHALGDFNLQMPATTWLVMTLFALPLAGAGHNAADTHPGSDAHAEAAEGAEGVFPPRIGGSPSPGGFGGQSGPART